MGEQAGTPSGRPTIAVLVGPILRGVPAADRPLVLAAAERQAAERYRAWAAEMPYPPGRAVLLACAEREEDIAGRVEALYPDGAARQQELLAGIPDLRAAADALFAGRPLRERFVIQAEGERAGAATWIAFAREHAAAEARRVFFACAGLEEESAAALDALIAGR